MQRVWKPSTIVFAAVLAISTSALSDSPPPWPQFMHDAQHTAQSQFSTASNTGSVKWQFTHEGRSLGTSVAIAGDGTIYVGTGTGNDTFFALNPNGTSKWSVSTNGNLAPAPAIGPDGTIYASAQFDGLYALDTNGLQKWKFTTTCPMGQPTVGPDGTIYITAQVSDCTHAAGEEA